MSVVSRTAQPMGRFAAALFNREAVPEFQPGPGRIPIILSKRLETHQVRTTADGEPICEDTHLLCCFWAIAVRFADQCISSGINCTIPTVPTRPSTSPSTSPPTTTPTTTPTPPPTTAETLPTTTHRSPQPPAARPPSHSGGGWQARPLPTVLPNFPLSLPTVIPPSQEPDGGNAIWPETVGKHVKTDAGGGAPYDPYSGTAPEFEGAPNDDANVQFVFAETSEATLFPTSPVTEATTPTTTAATTTATTTTPEATTKPNCFNYHRLCPFWADLGECTKNPFWMRPHCQKACKSCGETLEDVYAPKPKTGCANRHTLCPFWAFIGECARNPRWMLINCRPSCQVC
ncbi:Protein F54E4.4 [Aphelenchoides avenae]|nr:Protein F54E4.4 [Aphelenchus avenae]